VGGRDACRRLVASSARRIWIPPGLSDRAPPARRSSHGDRRRHKRDPADRHRSRAPSRRLMAATATDDLLARARGGDKRSIARLLSVVENGAPGAAEAMRALYPQTGRAQIVGITGPPGGGKCTLVNRLTGMHRARPPRVPIAAVDPSSPVTAR